MHLGIGAFHRAHQAIYIDDLLAADPAWAIVAGSLRSATTRDALKPQDWLYTLAVRSGEGERLRVIGSVVDVLVASEERERLLAAMADPRVRIVTLTVTEKGYCHDPATGALNEADPGIRQDLASPHAPGTAPGLVVEALARRRAAGVPPFTVLTCDNLPSNGAVVKRIIERFADAARRRSRRLGRRRGGMPLDHGRPHHAGHHRRGPRRASTRRWASATPGRWSPNPSPSGSSRIVSRPGARPSRRPAPSSSPMSRPTRR